MMDIFHYFLKIHKLNDSSKNESADESMSIIVSYSLGVCSRNKQGSSSNMAKDKAAHWQQLQNTASLQGMHWISVCCRKQA